VLKGDVNLPTNQPIQWISARSLCCAVNSVILVCRWFTERVWFCDLVSREWSVCMLTFMISVWTSLLHILCWTHWQTNCTRRISLETAWWKIYHQGTALLAIAVVSAHWRCYTVFAQYL